MGLVPGESPPVRTRRRSLRDMCEALWGPVLSSLTHVMAHCADPLVVSTAVDGYEAFAVAAGILGEKIQPLADGELTRSAMSLLLWCSHHRKHRSLKYVQVQIGHPPASI